MANLPDGTVHILPDTDIVTITGELAKDGPDFARVCRQHEWLSIPSASRHGLSRCPHCEAAKDMSGRLRYHEVRARLNQQMVDGVGPV